MQRLLIGLTFIVVTFSLNSTQVRSHTGRSDENIWWSYSGSVRTWSGNVERVFTRYMDVVSCRKYTLRKSTWDNNGWVEIGLNYNCYCWFSCIDRKTLVMPGDPDWMKEQANGKWCYGKQVKNQIISNNPNYYNQIMTDEQARDYIRDYCAQATRCQERCS